ncbi:MAG: molecular chaperone DnaJ [Anaerolineae bacterium]|nr:molecular chaperone DnaJ [Anaerolineae bacterium]
MADTRDYYEVLGVPRSASADDIRTAYRRLAREFHPDVNRSPEAAETFKSVNEAYQVLGDAERRQAYDRFGHAGVSGMNGFEGFNGFGGLGDIFEDLFGFGMRTGAQAHRAPQRGADLHATIRLSFRDAVFGTTEQVEISRLEPCDRCNGSGAEPGTSPVRCPTCNGTGQVRRMQQTILGSFVNVSTCPTCGGRGETITTRCSQCVGDGQVGKTRTIEVKVPAGVSNGTRMRMTGEGNVGLNGGPAGNLYVTMQVEDDPQFQRQGDDLILEWPISVPLAAMGATIEVPTLEEEERIKVPAGTQSGRVFRLKGRGVPHLQRAGRGDLVVVLRVVTPTNLTARQRELMEELADTLGENNVAPDEPGFLERMRSVLGL